MPIALLIALFLGGGAAYAAEGTLPGDTLYPVKVHINEEVRGWVSLSDSTRAEWETRRAERRLEEAEELAAEARFDADTRAIIETNFEEHARRVRERVQKFESRDPEKVAEIAANFETALGAHARILESIGLGRGGDVEAEVEKLLLRIRVEEDGAKEGKDEAEIKIRVRTGANIEAAAIGKARAAKNKIEEVKKFVERNKAEIGADARARAEARLKATETLYAEGQAKLDAKVFGEAFILFQRAQSTAQEVKLLLEAKKEFEDDQEDMDDSSGPGNGSSDNTSSSSVDIRSGEDHERGEDEQKAEDGDDDEEIRIEGNARLETNSGSNSGRGSAKGSIRIDLGF